MNEQVPAEDLIARLRSKHAGSTTQDAELMATAADCIEQLQMPPAKVRELAGTEEGADNLAMIRALCMQVEGQRKHIATLTKENERLRVALNVACGENEG